MVARRPPFPVRHPARTRAVVGSIAALSFVTSVATIALSPGVSAVFFAVAFAAAAVVAGADSRESGPHEPPR